MKEMQAIYLPRKDNNPVPIESFLAGVGLAGYGIKNFRNLLKSDDPQPDTSPPKSYGPFRNYQCSDQLKAGFPPDFPKMGVGCSIPDAYPSMAKKCLGTPEVINDTFGDKLAACMQQYVREHMPRLSLGRKLLRYDKLKDGELPRYERNPALIAHIIPRRGAVPEQIVEGDEVIVPTFEIACYPSVRCSDIKHRDNDKLMFNMSRNCFQALKKEEDTNVINLIVSMLNQNDGQVIESPELTRETVEEAFRRVEQFGYKVSHVVCHGKHVGTLRRLIDAYYDHTVDRLKEDGSCAEFWGADVHVSTRIRQNEILFVAAPLVGYLSERQAATALEANDPKKLRLGVVLWEEIGLVAMDYETASLVKLPDESFVRPATSEGCRIVPKPPAAPPAENPMAGEPIAENPVAAKVCDT